MDIEDSEDSDKYIFNNSSSSPYVAISKDRAPENGTNCQRVDENYRPGAIVRIELNNFVTYERAVFNLAPGMNIIIGPNGTGKSTFVCGICIGLGFSINVLGRANKLSDYVKYGSKTAQSSIKIKGNEASEFLTIERFFSDTSEASTWKLNGSCCAASTVKSIVASLKIQIDNLTQFLPQDKVASFASMTPQNLLRETERASLDDTLYATHEKLNIIQHDYNTVAMEKMQKVKALHSLEINNQTLKSKVERIIHHQKLKDELSVLSLRKKVSIFTRERNIALGLKSKRAEAKLNLENARNNLHSLEDLKSAELSISDCTEEYNVFSAELVKQKDRLDKESQILLKLFCDVKDSQQETYRIKNSINMQKRNIDTLKSEIKTLERQAESQVTTDKYLEQIRSERARLNSQILSINHKLREKKKQIIAATTLLKDISAKRATLAHEWKNMSTARNSLLYRMRNMKNNREMNDAALAVDWLDQNQSLFSNQVYEPGYLNISIKIPEYEKQIDSLLSYQTLLGFVCMSRKDYEIFTSELIDKQNLQLHVYEYSQSIASSFNNQKRICTTDELKQLGLDIWAIDVMDGPNPVLNHLCHTKGLHTIGITNRKLTDEQIEKLEFFSKTDASGRTLTVISNFVDATTLYRISRSDYHRNVVTSTVKVFSKGLLSRTIDTAIFDCLQSEIKSLDEQCQEANTKLDSLHFKKKELEDDLVSHTSEDNMAKTALNDVDKAMKTSKLLHIRAETSNTQLKRSIDKYNNDSQNMNQQKANIKNTALSGSTIAVNLCEQTIRYCEMCINMAMKDISLNNAKLHHRRLHDNYKHLKLELESTEKKFDLINAEFKQYQILLKEMKETVDKAIAEATSELVEAANDPSLSDSERSLEVIEERENHLIARLNTYLSDDPTILVRYEEQICEITKLKDSIARLDEDLTSKVNDIENIRCKWEPRLMRVINDINERFSEHLRRCGCVGEVSIHRDENNFEKWSIIIQVMFRAGEELSRLSSQRQSGGERAVSTIFYLLSLQGLVSPPFRLVDEINQGMDPQNERMVHERVIEIAAQEQSQTFLITPKLLNGLKYDQKMKIHCINNGKGVSIRPT